LPLAKNVVSELALLRGERTAHSSRLTTHKILLTADSSQQEVRNVRDVELWMLIVDDELCSGRIAIRQKCSRRACSAKEVRIKRDVGLWSPELARGPSAS